MSVIKLNQPIKVLAKFVEGKIKPCRFVYKGRVYDVKDINGSYLSKNNGMPLYFFSVETKQSTDFFELAFSFENLNWYLRKIVSEDFM